MSEDGGHLRRHCSTYRNSEFVEMDPNGRYGRYDEALGKGAYKTVYKAFDDVYGIEVAWNQVKIEDMLNHAGDIERLYSELHLLRTLKHRNIIKFYHSWIDMQCKNVNFITEIFTSGSLRQYRKRHKRVQLRAIKHWMRQILQGLVYLHSHDPPIIHRDLKCDNILINGNSGEVKIGDLGLAAILSQAPAAHSVIGTPEFMAPELYEERYNELVDIYSFGMCLLEMVTLEYPYSECENAAQIYKKVTTGKKPEALDRVTDPDIRQFIEKCLASARQRPSARDLLADPFLQSKENFEMLSMTKRQVELKHPGTVPEETQVADVIAIEGHAEGQSNVRRFSTPNSTSFEKLQLVDDADSKECAGKDMDLRIKGRKDGDKSVLLVIRITNSRGGVRYIQFSFDVETDTAISVASEMIAELDLADQDVSTVAAFIDEEIANLVPDWRPGFSAEEAGEDESYRHSLGCSDTDEAVEGRGRTFHLADESDEATASMSNAYIYGRFEEVESNVPTSEFLEIGSDVSQVSRYLSSEEFQNNKSSDEISDSEYESPNEFMPRRHSQKDSDSEYESPNEFMPRRHSQKDMPSESDNVDSEELRLLIQHHDQELELMHLKHSLERRSLKAQLETCSTVVTEQCGASLKTLETCTEEVSLNEPS